MAFVLICNTFFNNDVLCTDLIFLIWTFQPHFDGPLFHPTIATISCGSHCVLNFVEPTGIDTIQVSRFSNGFYCIFSYVSKSIVLKSVFMRIRFKELSLHCPVITHNNKAHYVQGLLCISLLC